jgi:DNA-binding MarR family transcriptional regulator
MRKASNIDGNGDIYKLFVLLRQTTDAIFKGREKELKKYGITPEQAAALIGIRAIGSEATPAEVSRWLFREPNSVSVLLSRMERQGLIQKSHDTHRRNLIRINLTEKGAAAYKHAIKLNSVRNIICALSKKKREQLGSLLEILRSQALENLQVDTNSYSRLFKQVMEFDSLNNEDSRPEQAE